MRSRADDVDSDGRAAHLDLPSADQIEVAVHALSLLADPTRLRLLWLCATAEHDVGRLAVLAGTTPAAASQHLAKLRLAGLVSVRHHGRRHLYSTRGGHVARLVREALSYADHQLSGAPPHP
ncbi:MAG: metalloregulator ArsR/SmtB family transcription factor [Actinomycetota bacterium]|jgi:DNA-binding transcriptional ArsR family regulator|nr:metalloregulator ArsR/SmtB family transcription factor [Actinomycetota bacterium]